MGASCFICRAELEDGNPVCPSCQARQPLARPDAATGEDPLLGASVADKYTIEALLGVGGMGRVYRAHDLRLDRSVVLKILHPHFQDQPKVVKRFEREARAASRLHHPNVIQVLDFGQEESGLLYIAMEHCEGQDLADLLAARADFPVERVVRLGAQICSALAEAHSQQVIHRDLKPENIMLIDQPGHPDHVKVLDFGIAKLLDLEGRASQALTRVGAVCGTPEYMSPEQARGQTLDGRSDVFGLGVLLYQLTTGRVPFEADTPVNVVAKNLFEDPVPPSQRVPEREIPAALDAVILKAMAKDPADRFQDVTALSRALDGVLGTPDAVPWAPPPSAPDPDAARPPTASPTTSPAPGARGHEPGQPGARGRARHLMLRLFLPLLGVAALAAAGVWYWPRDDLALVREALASGQVDRAMTLLASHPDRDAPEVLMLRARTLLRSTPPEPHSAGALLVRALDAEPDLLTDADVIADLIASLDQKQAKQVSAMLVKRVGWPAVPGLVRATGSPRYWLRWNAIELLETIGARDRVDRVQAYILDLEHARACPTRKRAAAQLHALGDPRALEPLRLARSKPVYLNRCMGKTLERAIAALEAPSKTPATEPKRKRKKRRKKRRKRKARPG